MFRVSREEPADGGKKEKMNEKSDVFLLLTCRHTYTTVYMYFTCTYNYIAYLDSVHDAGY